MSLDRHIVRLMAAVILAIIAYVAPSAVQAYEGHAHHGHHHAAAPVDQAAPTTAKSAVPTPAKPTARFEAPTWSKVALRPAVSEGARIEPAGDDCGRPGCTARCCGTVTCCAAGVLTAPYALSPTLLRTVTLIPRDVAGRSSPGPEALPKPPRTLA